MVLREKKQAFSSVTSHRIIPSIIVLLYYYYHARARS